MSTLFISTGGAGASGSGVWWVSGSDYQYNYNAFTPGEDVNLDRISISTASYDPGQTNPGNFRVGIYAAGVNASTPGSLISYLSGPASPTDGAYSNYVPTTSINLSAGSQYWLGFTLSSDTGGSNTQRVKISTSDGSSTYASSGWSVGTRYIVGSSPGLPTNSSRPATFELYGPGKAVCFCSGTLIRALAGEMPIDGIKIGDMVVTSKGPMAVKWIAKRTILRPLVPKAFYLSALPILIRANSIENGVPSRDLYVSGSHGIYVDGGIVNACFLVNELTITKTLPCEFPVSVRYYHLEFDEEVLVEANGAMACSYVNMNNRRYFDNYPEFISLYCSADLTASSLIRTGPRNMPSLDGHKNRVRRAWMPPGCSRDPDARNQAAAAQEVTF
jgi:hypothetical protein